MNDDQVPTPTPAQRFRATRAAAHHARNSEELAQWLDMLGLAPEEGLTCWAPEPRQAAEAEQERPESHGRGGTRTR